MYSLMIIDDTYAIDICNLSINHGIHRTINSSRLAQVAGAHWGQGRITIGQIAPCVDFQFEYLALTY
jgi:hypothetical protein